MALGTNHVALTEADVFIPELWSDEIIAAYKSNLVMRPLVTVMNHVGKKGDTIRIPTPTRGSATAKAAETQVTLIANTETSNTYTIGSHFHYARLIEDIVEVQALGSMRRFYVDDAGYALAKQVDTAIHTLGGDLNKTSTAYDGAVIGGDGSTAWDGSANTNTGNGTALTDAGIRRVIQTLDDNDVPGMNRYLVLPPVAKNTLLSLSRFTEQAFTGEQAGGNSIRNGLVGDVYGIPVYVSTNCATVQADDSSTNYRAGLMFQKDSLLFIEQMGVRVQSQNKLEWLGDLFVADMIYGTGVLRNTGGRAIIVPA